MSEHTMDPRYSRPVDMWASHPKLYVESEDTTIQLGWVSPTPLTPLTSVHEFNTWKGDIKPDNSTVLTRHVILLTSDLNEVRRILQGAADGEPQVLKALLRMRDVMRGLPKGEGYDAVLGWDFFRERPYFRVTWEADK